jgi:hypothetical protein
MISAGSRAVRKGLPHLRSGVTHVDRHRPGTLCCDSQRLREHHVVERLGSDQIRRGDKEVVVADHRCRAYASDVSDSERGAKRFVKEHRAPWQVVGERHHEILGRNAWVDQLCLVVEAEAPVVVRVRPPAWSPPRPARAAPAARPVSALNRCLCHAPPATPKLAPGHASPACRRTPAPAKWRRAPPTCHSSPPPATH